MISSNGTAYFTALPDAGRRAVFHLRERASRFPVQAIYAYRCTHCRARLLFAGASPAHPSRDVELYTGITIFILCPSLFLMRTCLRAGSARVLTCLEFTREPAIRTHCTHGKTYRYFCCLFSCYLTCASAVGPRTVGATDDMSRKSYLSFSHTYISGFVVYSILKLQNAFIIFEKI